MFRFHMICFFMICFFRLNILVVGLDGGRVQLYAYGIAAIGELEMSQLSQQNHPTRQVMTLLISEDGLR